jgi:hypothetical protein
MMAAGALPDGACERVQRSEKGRGQSGRHYSGISYVWPRSSAGHCTDAGAQPDTAVAVFA